MEENKRQVLEVCSAVLDSLWPKDCSSPSVHGILQARILEWGATAYSRGSSWLREIEPKFLASPAMAGIFFATSATWVLVIYSIGFVPASSLKAVHIPKWSHSLAHCRGLMLLLDFGNLCFHPGLPSRDGSNSIASRPGFLHISVVRLHSTHNFCFRFIIKV